MGYSDIKVFSLGVSASDIYENINHLALENIEAGTLPYTKETPLPQDMNIINGRHLGDINKIQLELKAASIGAKSLKWIYGADAELLQLELKDSEPSSLRNAKNENKNFDCEPIIALANTRRDISKTTFGVSNEANIAAEGVEMDAQCVYLLDQFTEKSIQRALKPQNVEKRLEMYGNSAVKKQIKAISQNLITYMSEYDTGLREASLRNSMRENLKQNFSKQTKDGKENPVYNDVTNTFKKITSRYDESQNLAFKIIHKYYAKQNTGLNMGNSLNPEQKLQLEESIKKLASVKSPRLAETLLDSYFFTERSSHYEFNHEKIYSKSDAIQKQNVLAPAATRFMDKEPQIERLMDDKERQNLRSRSREFKPHHLDRGLGR